MTKGYTGKILRVDMEHEQAKEEHLPEEQVLKRYIGGWGLGLWYLYHECPPGISSWDPCNPLILMTGPLTGTGTPLSNNTTIVCLNHDTGYTAGRAHTHGYWGPNLRWAGYDGLIVTGAARRPVYLWVHDGECEFRDAAKIWGKETHETEDLVKEDLGEPEASVAAIGPAGENLCVGAIIKNDKHYIAGHGGCGAVMGSKMLKAIAVKGSNPVPLAKEADFIQARDIWAKKVASGNAVNAFGKSGDHLRDLGFLKRMDVHWISKNWTTTDLPGFGAGFSRHKMTPKPCFACPIACGYDVEVVDGPFKGFVASLGGGGEHLEGAAAVVGVSEPGSIFFLVDLIDRLGFEGGTIGGAMGVAFEAYEKGLLTKERTGGLELRWGDVAVIEKLLRMAARREGFGDVIARGPLRAAEWIGGEAPDMAIHIKGSGMNFHDWKSGPWGTWFGQLVGGGTGWQTMAADFSPNPDSGFPVTTPRRTHVNKGREVALTTPRKYWVDSVGSCSTAFMDSGSLELSIESINNVTGWNINKQDAFNTGWRCLDLERAFNVRRGLRPEDDYIVSRRILEPNRDGPAAGMTFAPFVKDMVMEYYRECGWDEKTGKPWRQTLEKLGMEEIVKDLWE